MIAQVEKMNTRQENSEESQEAKSMLGNYKEKESEISDYVIIVKRING
jgi:hypothetical protein